MSLDGKRIVDNVAAALDEHRDHVRAYLDSAPVPPGLERADDATFAEFVHGMVQQWPPEPLAFPLTNRDGSPILNIAGQPAYVVRVVSPWVAMLSLKRKDGQPLVDGGEAVLKRIERLMAGPGPDAVPPTGMEPGAHVVETSEGLFIERADGTRVYIGPAQAAPAAAPSGGA